MMMATPNKSRRKSIVWDHFDETEKGKRAKCSYCPQLISISGGSLSNLARHIRKKHPSLLIFTESQDSFDFSQYSHEFVSDIIEFYKTNPCLWNPEIREYGDQKLKAKAYELLISKFKEVDSSANKDTVIRTINHMRTNYRKELKKIKEFSETANDNDVFNSELWYFDKMNFLQDIEMARSNFDETTEEEGANSSSGIQGSDLISITSEDCNPTFIKKKIVPPKMKTSQYGSVHELLGECVSPHFTDKFDYLAKTWSITIRSVAREQQIYAEKLISEVLCEAQLGSLSRESTLCTRVNVFQPTRDEEMT